MSNRNEAFSLGCCLFSITIKKEWHKSLCLSLIYGNLTLVTKNINLAPYKRYFNCSKKKKNALWLQLSLHKLVHMGTTFEREVNLLTWHFFSNSHSTNQNDIDLLTLAADTSNFLLFELPGRVNFPWCKTGFSQPKICITASPVSLICLVLFLCVYFKHCFMLKNNASGI